VIHAFSSEAAARRRFEGRHVFVSGGAAGVGAEAVRLFAAEGARISIMDIQADAADRLAEELMEARASVSPSPPMYPIPERVTQAVRIAQERFGGVDVLFKPRRLTGSGAILETTLADWRRLFAIPPPGVR
jgi:NAD(P)-dependent dehydrogenase (short-subunit alcohol dehydrogenase family)